MWYEAKREFIEAAARVMWADAWAQWREVTCVLCGHDKERHSRTDGPCEDCCTGNAMQRSDAWHSFRTENFSGQELTAIAPPTPQYALYEAAGLLARLEVANGLPLASLLRAAGHADYARDCRSGFVTHWAFDAGCDCAADAADFGGDIALQALGHGAGWFDNHAQFELTVPHIEFDYQDGEE